MRWTRWLLLSACLVAGAGAGSPASAQGGYDPAAALASQREAMAKLSVMDGVWRGPAWTILPSGEKHTLTQTERVGPMLDGAVKVVEGRGYEADGSVAFNAFAVISYDPAAGSYGMRSYAQGRAGDFRLEPRGDGWVWEIPAGPMTIRHTVTFTGGVWHEFGERLLPGKDPVRYMEMTLTRVDGTDWPAAGAVAAK